MQAKSLSVLKKKSQQLLRKIKASLEAGLKKGRCGLQKSLKDVNTKSLLKAKAKIVKKLPARKSLWKRIPRLK